MRRVRLVGDISIVHKSIVKVQLKTAMSFLIVEDNPVMRHAIRRVVGELASEINECTDGAEAMAAYCEHVPDWVLMDIEMQGKDGITATREICTAFPDARVVIVTNYDTADMRAIAVEAGAYDFVAKENLLDIQALVRGRRV